MTEEDPFAQLRVPEAGPTGLPAAMPEGRPSPAAPRTGAARIPPPEIPGAKRPRRWSAAPIVVVAVTLLVSAGSLGLAIFSSGQEEEVAATPPAGPAAPAEPPVPGGDPDVGGSGSQAEPEAAPEPERKPKKPRARDLLSPGGLSMAVAKIRQKAGGGARVLSLRVDRERVSFTGGGRGGLTMITVDPTGSTSVVQTGADAPAYGVPLKRIDPRAPSRILKSTGRRRQFDYVAASAHPVDGTVTWSAFFKSGRPKYYTADPSGRNVTARG